VAGLPLGWLNACSGHQAARSRDAAAARFSSSAYRSPSSRADVDAAWLGDLTITRQHDGTSTLIGPVADQAQLHGMLARLRDIGATLLSLNALVR
jgi:hypothetical protein